MTQSSKQTNEWDKVADFWHAEAGSEGLYHQHSDIDPVMNRLIGNVKGKNVIEIGCGNGYFARKLAKKGAKVTAFDFSSKMIAYADAEEKRKPLGIVYLERDAARLRGIKSAWFDIAVANMSLLDVAEVERAIKEAGRVLKPRGKLVFSILHPAFMFDGTWEKLEGNDRFGRIVWRYLRPYFNTNPWNGKQFTTKGYVRPIGFYMQALRVAGFVIADLREIATKKPIIKVLPGEKSSHLRISRYTSLGEKKEKLRVQKEIPYFLVFEAEKISKRHG